MPIDEENDEEMVRVPERLETSTATFLDGIPDHDSQSGSHDPSSDSGTSFKVGRKECDDTLAGVRRIRVGHGEPVEVDHMGSDVDDGEDDDGPSGGLVERDVLVEGNDIVQRRPTKNGNEVSANGQQDKDDIDVQDESGGTGNG